MKPFGQYVMNDVDRHGGIPVIMKAMLDEGLIHGDALTVTGKTVAENLAELDPEQVSEAEIGLHMTGAGSAVGGHADA